MGTSFNHNRGGTMNVHGTGTPLDMTPLILIEGIVVFANSSDERGIVVAALITGVFTIANGLLLAYFQHRWNNSNEGKDPKSSHRVQHHRRGGNGSTDGPSPKPPKRQGKGKG